MKKILLLALFTTTIFAQDFAKDTLMVGGTQPATILKIKSHKIIIAQNKELQRPYTKQKGGSFISNGVPFIEIQLDKKKHTIGSTKDYLMVMFDNMAPGPHGSNSIINVDDTKVFLHTKKIIKEKKEQLYVFYPLKDRFFNLNFVFKYVDETDRENKEKGVLDIIEHGFTILEDFYLK